MIGFESEVAADVRVAGSAEGAQREQLELICFDVFVGRQARLLELRDLELLIELLNQAGSSGEQLAAWLDQPFHLRAREGSIRCGYRIRIQCADDFSLGDWSNQSEDEAVWRARVRDWGLELEIEPFGFRRFGAKEKSYATGSVATLLLALGKARRDDPLALDRLAYAATESAHHGYPPNDPLPGASFVAHLGWAGQFCANCETGVDRLLECCPDCGFVFRGDPSVVLEGDSEHDVLCRHTPCGARATVGDTLTLSDNDLRLDLTPLELADPADVEHWSEAELRPIAVRVKVRNRGEETTDEISIIDARLIDQRGRSYEAHWCELTPSFDDIEELDPGETARGWIVFGLPVAAKPAAFAYRAGIGQTGVWTLAELPVGPPAPDGPS